MALAAVIVVAVFALTAVVCWGAYALRRQNQELARLRRHKEVRDKRWRALNVVDRCDYSPACHARSHEQGCQRGRAVGPFINQQLDQKPERDSNDNNS